METDRLDTAFETSHSKPMTLICPAYNEEAGVVASVNSLISLRYPEFQVVVVNDGSTDATLERLIAAFRLRPSHRVLRQLLPTKEVRGIYESAYVPNLLVVDKVNGGKADALNCGLNLARYPLVCCMDGDSLLENDSLLRIARPFMDRPGPGGLRRRHPPPERLPGHLHGHPRHLPAGLLAGPLPDRGVPPGLPLRPRGPGLPGHDIHRERRLRRLPPGRRW